MARTFFQTQLVRILLATIFATLFLGVAGCASDSPEMVVAKFTLAIAQNDTTKAKNYCTESFGNTIAASMQAMSSMMPANTPGTADGEADPADFAENLVATVSGNTARVTMKDAEFFIYVLVKEGGKWKIDSFDVNMPAGLMENLADIN